MSAPDIAALRRARAAAQEEYDAYWAGHGGVPWEQDPAFETNSTAVSIKVVEAEVALARAEGREPRLFGKGAAS